MQADEAGRKREFRENLERRKEILTRDANFEKRSKRKNESKTRSFRCLEIIEVHGTSLKHREVENISG